jgi:hypothetical protein
MLASFDCWYSPSELTNYFNYRSATLYLFKQMRQSRSPINISHKTWRQVLMAGDVGMWGCAKNVCDLSTSDVTNLLVFLKQINHGYHKDTSLES